MNNNSFSRWRKNPSISTKTRNKNIVVKVGCMYSDPHIKLEYEPIPLEGGTSKIKLEYYLILVTYYSDGTNKLETITEGATVRWSGISSTGIITAPATEETGMIILGLETVTVIMNGKSSSLSIEIYQLNPDSTEFILDVSDLDTDNKYVK